MTAHRNSTVFNRINTTDQAGGLIYQKFSIDFSVVANRPAALAAADTFQFGLVPAGHRLVTHLCRLGLPLIDSGGAPTGDFSLGITGAAANLKASSPSETPLALFGEDWLLADIGSATDDVPLLITIINASQAVPVTGVLIFEQVTRPFDPSTDS